MTTTTNQLPSISTFEIQVNAYLPELREDHDCVIGFEFDAPTNSDFRQLFDIGKKTPLRNVRLIEVWEGNDQDYAYQIKRDDLKAVFSEENYGTFLFTCSVKRSDCR